MLKLVLFLIFIISTNLFFFFLFNKKDKCFIKFLLSTLLFVCLVVVFNYFNILHLVSFLIIYLLNSIINIFIYYKNIKRVFKVFNYKKVLLTIFLLLNVSLILELTIFNFRSYLSYGYDSVTIDTKDIATNMDRLEDGTFRVNEDYPYIEIKDLNIKINDIYLNIIDYNNVSYYAIPFYTDEGNELYYRLDSRQIHQSIEKSKIFNFNTSGKSEKMKFEFTFGKGDIISINNIIINYKIPIDINLLRIGLCFVVLMFCYFFRPKSFLYKIKYVNSSYKLVILGLCLITILSFSFLSVKSILSFDDNVEGTYSRLANSLIEGKTYYEDENNSEAILNKMDNPYDTFKREEIFSNLDYYYLWDSAFYEGHYYSYFGVVPAVLFYVPFQLITGLNLSTDFIVYVITVITAILSVLLLHQIVKKYLKKCSVGLFFLLSLILIYCTGTLYFLKFPNTYSVPIVTGIMFTFLGLNLWLSCLKSKKMLKTKIALGSLSMALVAGCRPQLLVASFLAIPILYLYIKEKKPSRKEIIKILVIAIIPYLLVAGMLMYYNYIRFSSPFDFGANYNLTTNDMTKRGFVLARIPLGIVMYLFNPVNFQNVFPYIIATELHTTYLGTTIYEPIYGGVFFSIVITSINLFVFKLKKFINKKIIFYTCLGLIASALVIVIMDTEMAGILARYITDFSFLLIFSSILIILSINENSKINKDILLKIILVLVIISLLYQFFYFFVSILDQFKNNNLRFWLEFYYMIQFWI